MIASPDHSRLRNFDCAFAASFVLKLFGQRTIRTVLFSQFLRIMQKDLNFSVERSIPS
jgi:hypothetical protein